MKAIITALCCLAIMYAGREVLEEEPFYAGCQVDRVGDVEIINCRRKVS